MRHMALVLVLAVSGCATAEARRQERLEEQQREAERKQALENIEAMKRDAYRRCAEDPVANPHACIYVDQLERDATNARRDRWAMGLAAGAAAYQAQQTAPAPAPTVAVVPVPAPAAAPPPPPPPRIERSTQLY